MQKYIVLSNCSYNARNIEISIFELSMPSLILLILVLFISQSFGLENMRCGTLQFAENLKNPKKMLAKKSCVPENSNEIVYARKTTNFIIYYTKSGQHAIRYEAYIDSLALYFEQAYNMHKNTLGMKKISGAQETYVFRQRVPSGLYPIEILDTGYLLDETPFGLTLPKGGEIVIENDFLYYDANCVKRPFTSRSTGKDYSVDWDLALKATVFHELYHAFQTTYYNWQVYSTFWMEASATGVEEIGAPDVNDYINYLNDNFNNPGRPMDGSVDSEGTEEYGWATLYLFLYSQIDSRFDSAIWSYFSKYPKDNFAMQLARLADSLGKNAEDLFHEYAKQVFYSGSRAKFSPYKSHFSVDMPKWPNWRINTKIPVTLQSGTVNFIRSVDEPKIGSVARKILMQYGDSSVWVLSRLCEKDECVGIKEPDVEPKVKVKELVAYPNPWNPKTQEIHFKNSPARGIEIRSASGALLTRVKPEEGDSLLFWKPTERPAPGILYYRALPYGKNKVLIVQY